MYSEILLRIIACKALDINNSDIIIEKERYGKPCLENSPHFHYNISHTKNAIVLAVSSEPVGVDVEKIKRSEIKIAKCFFCDNEIKNITKAESEIDCRFCEIWTKKEAYIKYIGKGLSASLKSF